MQKQKRNLSSGRNLISNFENMRNFTRFHCVSLPLVLCWLRVLKNFVIFYLKKLIYKTEKWWRRTYRRNCTQMSNKWHSWWLSLLNKQDLLSAVQIYIYRLLYIFQPWVLLRLLTSNKMCIMFYLAWWEI